LVDVCAAVGISVDSVKAHGALYGEVAQGEEAYVALLGAVESACAPGTTVVLRAGSPAVARARRSGVVVSEEGFCDRAYARTGALVARQDDGALLSDPSVAAAQALALVQRGGVVTIDGGFLELEVDTLCVHGDSPGAVAITIAVRRVLEESGIHVAAMPWRA
jgi:UPF0271 protein